MTKYAKLRKCMNKSTLLKIIFAPVFMSSMSIALPAYKMHMFDTVISGRTAGHIQTIDSFTTPGLTTISVLKHNDGSQFIVKQNTKNAIMPFLYTIRDALGSIIAESIDAPVNRVLLIPSGCTFIGKKSLQFPATLHTFMPGIMVKNIPTKRHLYLQQSVKPHITEKGLSRKIIGHMATHSDLCVITALDTFIGNTDRHRGNFSYDQETNRFFGIDLESSFKTNLAQYACNLIKSLLAHNDNPLTKEELFGLNIYRNTLRQLIQLHTPKSICKTLYILTEQAKITSRTTQKEVQSWLRIFEKAIEANYTSCKKLVDLLDRLLKRST